MRTVVIDTACYRQFDADLSRDVPAEGYGGWHKLSLPLSLDHTGVVVMHAMDAGTPEDYPGIHRAVEYHGRATGIAEAIFPPLLAAARAAQVPVLHVPIVGDGISDYYSHLSGCLGGTPDAPPARGLDAVPDDVHKALSEIRRSHGWPGEHNIPDFELGLKSLDFLPSAHPENGEPVAITTSDLLAACHARGLNHLIYVGFAIDGCLLISPCGMVDMGRRGYLCSTIREAVTAVETKETARDEIAKSIGLWRVALEFGFVYDLDDLVAALTAVHG